MVLIAALSGSVYAAGTSRRATIGSAQIKNGSIKLADINPKTRRALRGKRGRTGLPGVAGTGAPGPAGPTGAAGPVGPAGSARAYGFVSSAGLLDAARSKNLTATKLTGSGAGFYCVTPTAAAGVTRETAFPVVSADFSDGTGFWHLAQPVSGAVVGCSNGWGVVTDNFTAGAFVRADIAFSIVVP